MLLRTKRLWWKRIAVSAALTAALMPAGPWTASAEASAERERMIQVLELLSGSHVSGISEGALTDAAIRAMVEAVDDPYTQYLSKEDYARFQSQLSRSYIGIGVSIGADGEGIFIGDVFKGSPASEAGLAVGDYILEAGGQSLRGLSTADTAGLIMGEENTEVVLKLLRNGETLQVKVIRRGIQLPVLESALLDGGVAYMKLYSFSEEADEQFAQALAELKTRPELRSLVLDLRDNPGGLLDSAARIAARFIPQGAVIHTKNRSGTDEPVTITSGESQNMPVYVLVNENSASASEVLAGALQDYGAAVIAGARTFGKGSVQQLVPFPDGASLKLTIEEYLTPNGHPVNGVGIKPDLELDGSLNQLLTVLRKAGVSKLHLDKNRYAITVNGLKLNEGLPAYEEDGRLWIHARVLAAMIGAETVWNPDSWSVEIRGQGGQAAAGGGRFSEALGNARFTENRMFLDAEAFEQAFPTFSAEGELDKLTLTAGGGN